MNTKHLKTGGLYEVRHIATWLPGTVVADNAEVRVLREKLTGEVAVTPASEDIPANYDVIGGATLQKAEDTDLMGRATMIVYASATMNLYARELNEFNERFDPKVPTGDDIHEDTRQ